MSITWVVVIEALVNACAARISPPRVDELNLITDTISSNFVITCHVIPVSTQTSDFALVLGGQVQIEKSSCVQSNQTHLLQPTNK